MDGEGIQRVAVVQPTGSGKSLLMAKLIEDNSDSRFFVLSTSHKINAVLEGRTKYVLQSGLCLLNREY